MSNILKVLRLPRELGFIYRICLRNERVFEIGDKVFFITKDELFPGVIVGKELTPDIHPGYIYKVSISSEVGEPKLRTGIKCDFLFLSLEEAKKSALDRAESIFNAQKEAIENYFRDYSEK